MPTKPPPILIFILSEASAVLTQRWIDAGKLPFLAQMAQNGSAGRLRSTTPFITTQMFADLFTGQRAQHHGVFDHVQRDHDGRFREVTRASIRCSTLWELLDQNSRSCGMVNLPLTWPPQATNGYMISGQDAPVLDRSIASPPGLYDTLTAMTGRYRFKDIFPGGRNKKDYLELFTEEIDWQTAVLRHLISSNPCDLMMTFFSATAMAQHYFWSDMDAPGPDNPFAGLIESVYRRLDAKLAELAGLAGPAARIFVISECGAGPLRAGVNINAWLHQKGFLHYRHSGRGTQLRTGSLAAAVGSAKRYLPDAVKSVLARCFPGLKAGTESYMAVSDIDWSRTTAYSRGKEGSIFINLQGRESHGILSAARYEEVVNSISGQLAELIDPGTGRRAISKVYRREELYPGCSHPGAPDLIIDFVDGAYMPTEANRVSDQVFGPRWRANMSWPTSGSHRPKGIFFAQGPGIDAGYRVEDASILDLMPTWLHMLDIPVPSALTGKVLDFCCRDNLESSKSNSS